MSLLQPGGQILGADLNCFESRRCRHTRDAALRDFDPTYVRFGSRADITRLLSNVRFTPERWGNRPASLWIAGRFGVLRFRLMVKRGPHLRPQASEGEAQHGLFCWTRRVGQGDERLHCG